MTLQDIAKAVRAAGAKHFGGCVSEQETEWRLGVCETCPKRRKPKNQKERASILLSGHLQGEVCDVCGCSLALLASATKANLHQDSPQEAQKRPSACWFNSL